MFDIICPKCSHCHEPSYSHEDDTGTWSCRACSFEFFVEIEYEPVYHCICIEHDFQPFEESGFEGHYICGRCGETKCDND